jgi:hypothetical protein
MGTVLETSIVADSPMPMSTLRSHLRLTHYAAALLFCGACHSTGADTGTPLDAQPGDGSSRIDASMGDASTRPDAQTVLPDGSMLGDAAAGGHGDGPRNIDCC